MDTARKKKKDVKNERLFLGRVGVREMDRLRVTEKPGFNGADSKSLNQLKTTRAACTDEVLGGGLHMFPRSWHAAQTLLTPMFWQSASVSQFTIIAWQYLI